MRMAVNCGENLQAEEHSQRHQNPARPSDGPVEPSHSRNHLAFIRFS